MMELDSPHLAERGFSCPCRCLPSCLPKREFLASFFTRSDCWTHSATESLRGRDLGIWHSGRVPWMCDGFPLCQVFAAALPSTWNTPYAQATAPHSPYSLPWLIPSYLSLSKLALPPGSLLWRPQRLGLGVSAWAPTSSLPQHLWVSVIDWFGVGLSHCQGDVEVGACPFQHCMSTA